MPLQTNPLRNSTVFFACDTRCDLRWIGSERLSFVVAHCLKKADPLLAGTAMPLRVCMSQINFLLAYLTPLMHARPAQIPPQWDLFDSALTLEEQHYEEGYEDGVR